MFWSEPPLGEEPLGDNFGLSVAPLWVWESEAVVVERFWGGSEGGRGREGESGATEVVKCRGLTGEDSAVEVGKKAEEFVPADETPLEEDSVGEQSPSPPSLLCFWCRVSSSWLASEEEELVGGGGRQEDRGREEEEGARVEGGGLVDSAGCCKWWG